MHHAAQFTRLFLLLALAAFAISACGGGDDWNADQEAVHKAMLEWSSSVTRQDAEAMWDRLSPDAQDIYKRELELGIRPAVKRDKAALDPEALTSDADRARIQNELDGLPEDPDSMTPKDYYVWRITPDLTPEGAQATAALFARDNVESITIDGERATVVLKSGDPLRYSWVRHDGVWKNDVKPSILRELESAREREKNQK